MSGPRDAIRLQSMRAHERAQIAEARLAAAEKREKYLRGVIADTIFGLRMQNVSREQVAQALENAMDDPALNREPA